jgi:hypothetical protein
MPAIITTKIRIHNAQQFYEAVSEAVDTNLFLFIGKITPWPIDSDPPIPTDTDATERLAWEDMIGGEQIDGANISHVIRRHDWTSGEIYVRYDDADPDLYLKAFYVVTDDFHVYKCISNNANQPSTVKPTGTGTSIITLGDGYQWKYMYTVETAAACKFATPRWLPVKELLADDGSNQWIVQQTTVDGGLHGIKVTVAGIGYTSAPSVIITGDGTGATATAQVDGAGNLTRIDIDTPGSGYSEATIELVGGGFTSPAAAEAIISPANGHGAHALKELGGFYVMVNAELEEQENGELPIDQDFRKIGLLRDPLEFGTTDRSEELVFDQTLRLNIQAGYTGTFLVDEVITGNTSGAEARVVRFDATNEIIHINEITGTFVAGENVITTGGSAIVDTITDPDLEPRSGDIIFIENRVPISRADDQTEQVRVIFEF